MTCLKCKANLVPVDNGAKFPLCRECRAELVLCGDEEVLRRADIATSMGNIFSSWEDFLKKASHVMSRLLGRVPLCEVCGRYQPYDPMEVRQGWLCERCHKFGYSCCMAICVREMRAVSICKLCRAELELSGLSIEEAHKPLPGKEAP